jgi:hypothetical protein
MGPGATQPIPPDVAHEVEPIGSVVFGLDFFSVPTRGPDVVTDEQNDDLGDPSK